MPADPSLKKIYLAAAGMTDAEDRAHFLDRVCVGNDALRRRVETLLLTSPPEEFMSERLLDSEMEETLPALGSGIGYFGDYILLSEIARGSSGVVFRARQSSLNRIVALKMLRDRTHLTSAADEQRFRAEAAAAASLDHPGIVPIYEVGQHEGQGYYSMKLIEGGTLQLRAGEFRDPRRAAALVSKVARAVHHAHQHGILHRDLKPGNILLDREGAPFVVDFGIARQMGADSSLTHTGQIIGTPHYMSPEQARGQSSALTPATDVYSLGAILYELLSGRRPFDADSMFELLKQTTEAAPPPLRLADRDLEGIVLHCLEKAPARRYGTAAELADDLDRWLAGEPVSVRPAGMLKRWSKRVRRLPAPAALVAIVLAGAVYVAFRPPVSPAPVAAPTPVAAVTPPAAPPPVAPVAPPASLPPEAAPPERQASEWPADEVAANRRAAEWMVRATGPEGFVTIQVTGGRAMGVRKGESLPPGEFIVKEFSLDHFGGPGEIEVTETGFRAAVPGLTRLERVFLRRQPLSSEALGFLSANPDLWSLTIEDMPMDDGIFVHLKGLKKLRDILIVQTTKYGPGLTGKGLEDLACLPILQSLLLHGTSVSDASFGMLDQCPKLRSISFATGVPFPPMPVTDATLRLLKNCPALERLDAVNCPVTDAGLAELHGLSRLREVFVDYTKVTDAGVEALRRALPGCFISRRKS